MFGVSFAKPFLIRSLHDAVHLVTKAKFKELTPDAVNERLKAAELLAEEAKKFAIPLAKAFLLSFDANGYGDTTLAKKAFGEKDYCKGLGLLIGEAKKNADDVPANVGFFLQRLKKAFPAEKKESVLEPALLTCDGPGVMLLELSSKCTTTDLEIKSDIFEKGDLHEQIENDLRGKIDLVGHHATITCGEVKSSFAGVSKGKEQLIVRTRFLKTVVDTIFAGQFREFILIGHLFVPTQAADGKTQLPANELRKDEEELQVSIYIHAL